MSPIVASFKSIRGYGLGLPSQLNPTGSFDALSSYTVPSGGASSITFAGIPQSGYQHLQLRMILRDSTANSENNGQFVFNNDTTGTNYARHYLQGNGSAASSIAYTGGGDPGYFGYYPGNSATSNLFGTLVMDILDYTNTSKNKTVKILNGYDANGSGKVALISNVWLNTSVINTIKLSPGGSGFVQYSQFALYGIRG